MFLPIANFVNFFLRRKRRLIERKATETWKVHFSLKSRLNRDSVNFSRFCSRILVTVFREKKKDFFGEKIEIFIKLCVTWLSWPELQVIENKDNLRKISIPKSSNYANCELDNFFFAQMFHLIELQFQIRVLKPKLVDRKQNRRLKIMSLEKKCRSELMVYGVSLSACSDAQLHRAQPTVTQNKHTQLLVRTSSFGHFCFSVYSSHHIWHSILLSHHEWN